ncbi:unnamed protein product [Toxocara canis]|nr:unnamed protein product [Toxocara canis]
MRWRPPLLVAISAGFSFQEKAIPDEVIRAEKALRISDDQSGEWEVMVEQDDLRVVRRALDSSGLYEYRCSGTYRDITARDFVDAQVDLDYRQKWDTNVLKLELLYSDEKADSQVIRWIAKFPYPMYPREYIFMRRRYVDENEQSVVIASSALDHKLFPVSREYVRVQTYRSVMVVRAHTCFDEKGLDFVLTYYDNPESNMPSYAYNWVVNRAGPHFLLQVHAAARELERMRSQKSLSQVERQILEVNKEEEKGFKGGVGEGLIEGEEGVEVGEENMEGAERTDAQGTLRRAREALRSWYDRLAAMETPESLRLFD